MPNFQNQNLMDNLVVAHHHDARALADFFGEDAVHGTLHAERLRHGRGEIDKRHLEVFAAFGTPAL